MTPSPTRLVVAAFTAVALLGGCSSEGAVADDPPLTQAEFDDLKDRARTVAQEALDTAAEATGGTASEVTVVDTACEMRGGNVQQVVTGGRITYRGVTPEESTDRIRTAWADLGQEPDTTDDGGVLFSDASGDVRVTALIKRAIPVPDSDDESVRAFEGGTGCIVIE